MTKLGFWTSNFFSNQSRSLWFAYFELWCNSYPYKPYTVHVLRVTLGDQDNYTSLTDLLYSLGFQRGQRDDLSTDRLNQ